MKKTFVLTFSFLLIINSLQAQNEFGAVGSYWMYTTDINVITGMTGTVMIRVEKDTIIDGETYKILNRIHSEVQTLGEPPKQWQNFAGLLRISNDSVFHNEQLIMDFDMMIGDTIPISDDPYYASNVVVDSIVTENIDGFDYKKWHGRRLCVNGYQSYENELYIILESVGQISNEYLFWNYDCGVIGSGIFRYFECYKNGDFTYPPSNDCAPLLISTTQVNDIPGLELFPNPVEDVLNINIKDFAIKEVAVFDINGKEILRKKTDINRLQINTIDLQKGTYLIQIQTKDEMTTRKFVKT